MSLLKELRQAAQNIKLLYVEDEPSLRDSVSRYLGKIFPHLDIAENGEEGLSLYQDNQYDIIITDIEMPKLNGIEMSKAIKAINAEQDIIITSAYTNPEYFVDAIKVGITGYIIKPVDFSQVNQILSNTIIKINRFKENEEYNNNLEQLVAEKTREYKQLQDEKVHNYKKSLYSIVNMIEDRDAYTGGHSIRVAEYSQIISRAMNYSDDEVKKIYQAGMLHDLGKLATPDSILLNPGKLNSLEYKLIKEHVSESYNLLKNIPMFSELADIVGEHHERHDGHGYPHGKKGDEILPLSRIMIVADAFDAMTTNRIYKGRKSIAEALEEIRDLKGKQFHPDVVVIALDALKDIQLEDNISQLPQTDLEKERFSYFFKDVVTQAYNRNYLDIVLTRNSFDREYDCINIVYLHKFSAYNHKHGWNKGDELLKDVALCLNNHFPNSLIFRVHGDDFVILSKAQIDIDEQAINLLPLLNNAEITTSIVHHNLTEERIENMNIMDRYLLSPISELQKSSN
ncbi:MAG: response regulator [gamma proteobacterium symbiont of Taylorina sp.]|nr:response regulator [gamma proteobacterium symbiont of Taylorina sp.]